MKTLPFKVLMMCSMLIFSASAGIKNSLRKSELTKDYIQIPNGKALLESKEYDVGEFYISKYEVTNEQYLKFLYDLKADGEEHTYSVAQVKNENWEKLNIIEGIGESYFEYPGFKTFPVVNVTYEAALLYCRWLTKKVNEELNPKYPVEFRLPTRIEWIRAARGDTNEIYAWHAPYLMNEKGKYLCNFKRLGLEAIHFNRDKNDYEIVKLYDGLDVTITTKSGTYQANAFGLYDMCGNVAEMISEQGSAVGGSYESPGYDVRVESVEQYQEASPLIGFRPVMIIKK